MADVKKVKDLRKEDLTHLSAESFEILKSYTKDSLVLMARRETLFNELMETRGIYRNCGSSTDKLAKEAVLCKRAADEFTKSLHDAGFIRNDFEKYKISFNIMTFLRIILNDCYYSNDYFNEFLNTRREWKRFTNDEYEEIDGLTKKQIDGFMAILHSSLSERAYMMICLRLGLVGDGTCVSRAELAKSFEVTEREIELTESYIFKQMSRIINREILEKMYQNFLQPEMRGLIKARN